MEKEILFFIKHFSGSENTFLYGCCYWFAFILSNRFHGQIFYEPRVNHYITKIEDKFYDVTGNVTEKYQDAMPWDTYIFYDCCDTETLVRDCILKLPYKEKYE